VTESEVATGLRDPLLDILGQVSGSLGSVSNAITHTWFTHVQELHALNEVGPRP
jgi:hypothetical protein